MPENSASGAKLVLPARAKLNLYLHILGRRPDSYHLIDSYIAFADIADTITIEPASELTLVIDGPFACAINADPDNLVLRAARILDAEKGARITLTKVLPVAAGLGGGSADAAAALVGLNSLWRLSYSPEALAEMGAALGADVPVCVNSRPAYVSGIGDILEDAPLPPRMALVLVNPGVPVSTPKVFAARSGPFTKAARLGEEHANARSFAAALAMRENGLTDGATQVAPIVGDVLAAIAATENVLLARLCGSGATCFGLYEDAAAADAAASSLKDRYPDWWVCATGFSS